MNTMTWLQNGAAWAWHTSLMVAVPALVLVALGRWRGFSARWRMLFAAALLFRLLLPWVPELPGHPGTVLDKVLPAQVGMVGEAVKYAEIASVEEAVVVMTPHLVTREPHVSWQSVAATIWAVGVVGIGIWIVGSHWLIRRWVSRNAVAPDMQTVNLFRWSCERMGLQRRVGLVAMPGLATAAVSGWLKPIVLVPANLRQTHTEDEIRGILLHELAHVRRCDVLWSWLGLSACALHWFNPLAWLALRRFHADRELDCDRMALAKLTEPQRNAYAPALFKALQCPAPGSSPALVPFFRHRHEIHTRILTIMKPTKCVIASFAALLIIPALAVLTLTKASADTEGAAKKGDGEQVKTGPRDGETKREGPRDGETKKEGPRDGEIKKEGARDGEGKRTTGERDGEGSRKGARDGEKSAEAVAITDANAMALEVLGQGEQVSFAGKSFATNKLRGTLSEYVAAHGETFVAIKAGDTVPAEVLTEVTDAVRDCGAKLVRIKSPRDGEARIEGSTRYEELTARSNAFRKKMKDQADKKAAREGDREKAKEGEGDKPKTSSEN